MNIKYFWKECGHVGKPKKVIKGSFFIELILWFLMIIPGLIYTLWRLSTKNKVCPKCEHDSMIPGDSPIGEKLIKKFEPQENNI